MAKTATLTHDKDWYNPVKLKALLANKETAGAVRKEYTRLRDISQKRLKRLKAAGFAGTQTYKRNYKHYPVLKKIKTDEELAARLTDLAFFIMNPSSKVRKARARMIKSIDTLHSHGYTWVSQDNYIKFGEFMESYRDTMMDMIYDSGDAVELFSVVEKHNLNPMKVKEDFDLWLENLATAEKLNYSAKSAGDYDKMKKRLEVKVKKANKAKE